MTALWWLFPVLALALGYFAGKKGIAMFREMKAKPLQEVAQCPCEVCTAARELSGLMLRASEIGQLQVAVVNVRRNAAPIAICEAEFARPDGIGSTVLVVTNDVIYQRVIRPAMARHFSVPGTL